MKGDAQKLPMFTGTSAHRGVPKNGALSHCQNNAATENILKETSKGKKHTDGNEKRLQAQREMTLLRKTNNAVVQHALRNIDMGIPGPNKKILFNEESAAEEEKKEEVEKHVPVVKEMKQAVRKIDNVSGPKEKQQLFSNDSSDEGDEIAEGPSFHVRDEFEGTEGQKLFALQSRFNNDARFKVDKRFLEDEDSSSSDVSSRKKKHKRTNHKTVDDETTSNTSLSRLKDTETEELDNSVTTSASAKFYYAVSDRLNDLFSHQVEKPKFSFFNGTEKSDDLNKNTEDVPELNKPAPGKRTHVKPSTKREDESSNFNPFKASGWFFIKPDDKELLDGSKLFSKQDSDDEIKKKWSEARPTFLEIFRKLRREKGRPGKKKTSVY